MLDNHKQMLKSAKLTHLRAHVKQQIQLQGLTLSDFTQELQFHLSYNTRVTLDQKLFHISVQIRTRLEAQI